MSEELKKAHEALATFRLMTYCSKSRKWTTPDGIALGSFAVNDLFLAMDRGFMYEHPPAEHPSDDDEPISEEWLLTVGGEHGYDGLMIDFFGPDDITMSVFLPDGANDTCHVGMGRKSNGVPLDHIKTRGDVRRLCAALGIELKEQK